MAKFVVQLPAVVRSALRDAKHWFSQVGVEDELLLLKVEAEPAPNHPGCEWVGLVFERGLRFYVVYRPEAGIHVFYNPLFVHVWVREQEGYEGNPPTWAKWQWQNEGDEAELRRVS